MAQRAREQLPARVGRRVRRAGPSQGLSEGGDDRSGLTTFGEHNPQSSKEDSERFQVEGKIEKSAPRTGCGARTEERRLPVAARVQR